MPVPVPSDFRFEVPRAKPCQTRLTPTPQVSCLMSVIMAPTALPRAAPGAPAEEQAAAFEDDPRVHFDTQSARWRLEDGDAEFEYEPSRAVWFPVVSLPLPTPQRLRDGPVRAHAAIIGRRGPGSETAGRVFDSRCRRGGACAILPCHCGGAALVHFLPRVFVLV